MQQDTGMHPVLRVIVVSTSGRWSSSDLKRVFSGLRGTPRCLRGKDTRGNQIKWIKSSAGSSVMSVCCRSQLCSAAVTEVNTEPHSDAQTKKQKQKQKHLRVSTRKDGSINQQHRQFSVAHSQCKSTNLCNVIKTRWRQPIPARDQSYRTILNLYSILNLVYKVELMYSVVQ